VGVTVAELLIADEPEAWRRAGFRVSDAGDDAGLVVVGSVRLRLVGRGRGTGVVGWSLTGVPEVLNEIDGLPTHRPTASEPGSATPHPNGTASIDHVVLLTPDLARTLDALSDVGLAPRRHRDGELGGSAVRQVFYRLGDVILEVVGDPEARGEGPADLWGITFTVADIDVTAAYLGERAGRVKDAVQPGRRITTLRGKDLGVSVATAFISPHVPGLS